MSTYSEKNIKSVILFAFILSAILLWSAFSSVSAFASSGRHTVMTTTDIVAKK